MVTRSALGDRVLVIMAKAPRPGSVKTRLTSSVSGDALVSLYCCLLDDTLALACSLSDVEIAIMCPESDVTELRRRTGNQVTVVAQKGQGLAAGLTSVFAHFTADCERRVIAFNSDSPHLPSFALHDGFELLARHDVVIGPTVDGGYYLVGAKAFHPTLFACDGMGTSTALARLQTNLQASQLSVGFTQPFYDVDVSEDLLRLAADLRAAPERAPRTAAWLAEWEGAGAEAPTLTAKL